MCLVNIEMFGWMEHETGALGGVEKEALGSPVREEKGFFDHT